MEKNRKPRNKPIQLWSINFEARIYNVKRVSSASGAGKVRQPHVNHLHHTIALTSHTSKVMLKILQARLQQYVSFQMFKLVLEKAEEPEIILPTSSGLSKKEDIPGKHLVLL